jgi:fumarate hydratase subunit alpha
VREIFCEQIDQLVSRLCIDANIHIPKDVEKALVNAAEKETSNQGRVILEDLQKNIQIARYKKIPICQDTGMAVVFVRIGQEVHVVGGSLEEAVLKGVQRGYKEGYLRASVVSDPFIRTNTGDNTPPVIHYEIVPGEEFDITVAPKGFGSENMSAMKMLKPSDGKEGVVRFVVHTVRTAGSNPCPPVIVGVGIGGTIEKASLLAKKSLLRVVGDRHPERHIAELENRILKKICELGIGPGGLGGLATALAVHIETYPTHIAGLPVVVNMSCHATRHASGRL